nr:hypothetical protein [Desulfobacterales bacterium]
MIRIRQHHFLNSAKISALMVAILFFMPAVVLSATTLNLSAPSPADVSEGNDAVFTVTVSGDDIAAGSVVVDFNLVPNTGVTSGDFSAGANVSIGAFDTDHYPCTLTITGPLASSATVDLPIRFEADGRVEVNDATESIMIQLTGTNDVNVTVSGAPAAANIISTDTTTVGLVSSASTLTEGGSAGSYTVEPAGAVDEDA